jgi:hypothetical protein
LEDYNISSGKYHVSYHMSSLPHFGYCYNSTSWLSNLYLFMMRIKWYLLFQCMINIVVVMMMMFVGWRLGMIRSWVGYKIWDFWSVNRLYVDNLGPPGIGKTLPKFWQTITLELHTHTHTHTHTHNTRIFL